MSVKKNIALAALAAVLLGSTAMVAPASAEGFKTKSAGDVLVRARGVYINPIVSQNLSIGGDVEVSNTWIPELDFSYFLTDNVAMELILGTSRHSVSHDPSGLNLGKVSLLPPTLTVQYHPLPKSRISPYFGAGINYTIFYDEDSGAVNSIDYQNTFGFAFQAGVDVALYDAWSFNIDVKRILLNTDVSINDGAITGDVGLDPWLVGFGVGYRF